MTTFFILQRVKLIDNMIFHLAALPKQTYDTLLRIFDQFESSKLQTKKKAASNYKPDCPGANFRELRNLDETVVSTLLEQVEDEEFSLSHLNKTCKRLKKIAKLKQQFAKEVGVTSWEEAEQQYPLFATEAALERFVKAPKLAGPVLAAFQQYCSRAIRSTTAAPLDGCQGAQSIELTVDGGSYLGVHLTMAPEELTFQNLTTLLPQFPGCPLIIMRVAGRSEQEVSFNFDNPCYISPVFLHFACILNLCCVCYVFALQYVFKVPSYYYIGGTAIEND